MVDSLSPLGWVLIILLVAFIIGINLSLFFSAQKKNKPDNWVDRLNSAGRTLQDPFHKENEKIDELSQKVRELEKKKGKEIN